jgi:prophage antirepressor-like protein
VVRGIKYPESQTFLIYLCAHFLVSQLTSSPVKLFSISSPLNPFTRLPVYRFTRLPVNSLTRLPANRKPSLVFAFVPQGEYNKSDMKKQEIKKGEIVIYQTSKKEVDIRVRFDGETVWLKQDGIAKLYSKERSVITKHINKIFADKEVDKKSNVHFLHIAGSDKPVVFYNLDVILAVGYRTNSARAIHFRKWATNVLKKYLLHGYAVNEKRLLETREKFKELQDAIELLQGKARHELLSGQEQEILNLLADYSKTLTLLDQYDKEKLSLIKKTKGKFILKYEEAKRVIRKIKTELSTLIHNSLDAANSLC